MSLFLRCGFTSTSLGERAGSGTWSFEGTAFGIDNTVLLNMDQNNSKQLVSWEGVILYDYSYCLSHRDPVGASNWISQPHDKQWVMISKTISIPCPPTNILIDQSTPTLCRFIIKMVSSGSSWWASGGRKTLSVCFFHDIDFWISPKPATPCYALLELSTAFLLLYSWAQLWFSYSIFFAAWGNVSKVLHIFHQNTSNFIETHQKTMVFFEAHHRSNLRGQPGQYGTRDSREKR